MTTCKTLSTLLLLAGMVFGSTTAWAFTAKLSPGTPVAMSTCGEVVEVPFSYLEPVEQELVSLSVKSYNTGKAMDDACAYKNHEGYPMFTCERGETVCYAGWVTTVGGVPEFEVGCGDANPNPTQCDEQEFECCDEQIGSHIFGGCAPLAGGTCGGIWVPCEEAWVDCG